MTPERAIREHWGVNLPPMPEDGAMRWFKIDQLRNGFIIKIGGKAVFGSIIDGFYVVFDGDSYFEKTLTHKARKGLTYEWLVWEAARVMLERGERLSNEDGERLALAVKRLEGWL